MENRISFVFRNRKVSLCQRTHCTRRIQYLKDKFVFIKNMRNIGTIIMENIKHGDGATHSPHRVTTLPAMPLVINIYIRLSRRRGLGATTTQTVLMNH